MVYDATHYEVEFFDKDDNHLDLVTVSNDEIEVVEPIRAELVRLANAMLGDDLQLIEGCRRINALCDDVAELETHPFLVIKAIESETDHYPLGAVREKCAPVYLDRMDAEMGRYLSETREDILNACREIVRTFSGS